MDDQVFDALVRRLAAARSRRQALATFGGGALTAALMGLGRQDVDAQDIGVDGCRSRLEFCQEVSDCCSTDSHREIECSRVSRKCDKKVNRKRCVGGKGAKCGNSCDCARGLRCKGQKCR